LSRCARGAVWVCRPRCASLRRVASPGMAGSSCPPPVSQKVTEGSATVFKSCWAEIYGPGRRYLQGAAGWVTLPLGVRGVPSPLLCSLGQGPGGRGSWCLQPRADGPWHSFTTAVTCNFEKVLKSLTTFCFGRRVGLDDPQRSLPTPTIL